MKDPESTFALEDPLLTVEDVASALQLNQQTIRNYIDAGVIPAVRVGGRRVRIRRSALDAFIAAGEKTHTENEPASAPDGESFEPEADRRARLGAALADSSAALANGDDDALATALSELADAARSLADALGVGRVQEDDS